MAARPLHELWRRADHPLIDRWIGRHDVVWGPNFVCPPTRAAELVTVHDLTAGALPRAGQRVHAGLPRADPPGAARGAPGSTPPSEFVRDEVIDALRRRPRPGRRHPPRRRGPAPVGAADGDRGRALAGRRPLRAGRRARSSPARTCPRWCGRSTPWPPTTPTCASSSPAPTAGAPRRSPPRSPPPATATAIVRLGLGRRRRPGRPAGRRRRSTPTRPCTRASACRRSRPWRPGVPVVTTRAGVAARGVRRRRRPGRRPATPTPWPPPSAGCSATTTTGPPLVDRGPAGGGRLRLGRHRRPAAPCSPRRVGRGDRPVRSRDPVHEGVAPTTYDDRP